MGNVYAANVIKIMCSHVYIEATATAKKKKLALYI